MPFKGACQNTVSKILIVRNIRVSTWKLQNLAEKKNLEKIDLDVMISAGLVSKNTLVKILGKGTLDRKLEVYAHAFSKSAVAAIEAKNGAVVKI